MEFIAGVFHLIHLEYCLQAAFVEGGVVGNQGQTFYLGRYFCPDFREDIRIHRVFQGQTVNPSVPIRVILRFGLDEAVVTVCNLTIPHYHNAHRADACTLRNLSLQNLSFPYPLFQYLLQIIRRIHPQLLSDIATLGGDIGFCLIEQDTDFTQLLILQDEITDFPLR